VCSSDLSVFDQGNRISYLFLIFVQEFVIKHARTGQICSTIPFDGPSKQKKPSQQSEDRFMDQFS